MRERLLQTKKETLEKDIYNKSSQKELSNPRTLFYKRDENKLVVRAILMRNADDI